MEHHPPYVPGYLREARRQLLSPEERAWRAGIGAPKVSGKGTNGEEEDIWVLSKMEKISKTNEGAEDPEDISGNKEVKIIGTEMRETKVTKTTVTETETTENETTKIETTENETTKIGTTENKMTGIEVTEIEVTENGVIETGVTGDKIPKTETTGNRERKTKSTRI